MTSVEKTRGVPLDSGSSLPDLRPTLELLAQRLRRAREYAGMPPTVAASRAGLTEELVIGLESGRQAPTLELILPLARAYRVSIDDLCEPATADDPRIHASPRRVCGWTVLPLTRPEGLQVWKIHVPPDQSTPRTVQHSGVEWLHVVSGELRLTLGDRDILLQQGDAAEFDPRTPHWYSNSGQSPAELLTIFGHRCDERLLSPHERSHASTSLPSHPHEE
jgi:quercetin dioxygenase-like cupin family protein/DNA-binding XRE family transcriptional regulator